MLTRTELKALMEARGLAPRKHLGQNFLIDHNLLRKLVDAADLAPGDLVLEVGPGAGALTCALLETGCDLIACELDEGLADLIADEYANPQRGGLTLIRGDCLATKRSINEEVVRRVEGRPFKLVSNLPYQAATPLMLTLALRHPNCSAMHVTIQKEVAERILAHPGSRDYGELSVLLQALCEVKRIASAPPECFWPRPKVTSAMISITRRAEPLTSDLDALLACTERAFSSRRKQLGALLGRDIDWPQGVESTMRAEQLTVEQFIALAKALSD